MIKQISFLVLIMLSSCKVVKPVTIQEMSSTSLLSVTSFYNEGDKSWSAAFDRAISAAQKSKHKTIFIPSGEYTITKQISLPKDIDLIGESMGNTIIRAAQGDYPDAIIRVKGAKIEKLSIRATKPISVFDRKISVNNTNSIKEGDVLLIRSNKKNSWCDGFEKGEYIKVQGVGKKSINIFGQLYDDYSAGELEIYSYKGTKSSLKNLTVIGLRSKMLACIRMEGGLENDVSNLKLKGSGYAGLVTILGFNQTFNNIHSEKSEDDKNKGYSYGINIGNSQNIKLSNCNLYGVRHGLTFGGAGTLKIPNRLNTCINSTLSSSINFAASFHPNTEFCSYISCNILGGAVFRGKSNTIEGCNIFNLQDEKLKSNEHCIHFSSSVIDLNHIVSNNRITLSKTSDELLISYQDNNNIKSDGGELVIKDNVMKIVYSGVEEIPKPVINFNFKNTTIYNGLVFKRNKVSADKGNHLIQVRSFNDKNLDLLVIDDNIMTKVAIHVQCVNTCYIKNNIIDDHQGSAISIHEMNTIEVHKENLYLENNNISNVKGYDVYIIGSSKYSNKLVVRNNNFTNDTNGRNQTRRHSINLSNINSLYLLGNIMGDQENTRQKTQAIISNVKSKKIAENVLLGKGELQNK